MTARGHDNGGPIPDRDKLDFASLETLEDDRPHVPHPAINATAPATEASRAGRMTETPAWPVFQGIGRDAAIAPAMAPVV